MKLPRGLAARAGAFFSTAFRAEILFAAVILCFPAFLLQEHIGVLALETAFFFLVALFRRGAVRVLSPLLVVLFITGANALTPFGKVLFSLGSFPVTEGALRSGLRRGLVLTGMVFMSQAAVSPAITLPGKAGEFLAAMFAALDAITAEKITLAPKGDCQHRTGGKGKFSLTAFIDKIDERLLAAEERLSGAASGIPGGGKKITGQKTTVLGALLLGGMILAMYGALFAAR